MNITPISEVYNMDCVAFMREYPDKYFDLAICDPPYGIGADKKRGDTGKNKHIKQKDYSFSDWDKKPPPIEYFTELLRVSKNQIIWGANHFIELMPYNSSCWIVWDKMNGDNLYADCELAWASFDKAVRKFEFRWHGYLQGYKNGAKEERIHQTQKPIALYEWLLRNYANKNDKILDTHLGSQSSRIASYKLGFDFYGCEIAETYFNEGNERFNKAISMPLFDNVAPVSVQLALV